MKIFKELHKNQLQNFSEFLAPLLIKGQCIVFVGELGSGKTQLIRSLLQFMLPENCHIQSPTFPLFICYDFFDPPIWHVDLYRLMNKNSNQQNIIIQLEKIGLFEAINENIVLIEWPELIQDYLPKSTLYIHINFTNDINKRTISVTKNKGY